LNAISERVTALNVGIGENKGVLRFTSDQDTVNHVLSGNELDEAAFTEVPVRSLDDILVNIDPTVIKIDVEGFETNVIKGADSVLSKSSLLAVLMELNGSGDRYGFDEKKLHDMMLGYGFSPYSYNPFKRELTALNDKNNKSGNTLYLRGLEKIIDRVKKAPKYNVKATGCDI